MWFALTWLSCARATARGDVLVFLSGAISELIELRLRARSLQALSGFVLLAFTVALGPAN